MSLAPSTQVTAGRTGAARSQDIPEQRVVVVSAAVVAYRRLDVGREGLDPAKQLLDGAVVKVCVTLQGSVQLAGVPCMVLPVMDLHGAGVDVGFQRVVRVSQLGQLERVGHAVLLGCVVCLVPGRAPRP